MKVGWVCIVLLLLSSAPVQAQDLRQQIVQEIRSTIAFQLNSDDVEKVGRWDVVDYYLSLRPKSGDPYHTALVSREYGVRAVLYSTIPAICWVEAPSEPNCRTFDPQRKARVRLSRLVGTLSGGILQKQSLQLKRTEGQIEPFWVTLAQRLGDSSQRYVWVLIDAVTGEGKRYALSELPSWVDTAPVSVDPAPAPNE